MCSGRTDTLRYDSGIFHQALEVGWDDRRRDGDEFENAPAFDFRMPEGQDSADGVTGFGPVAASR